MTDSFNRVAAQIRRIAEVDSTEAVDICLSHFNVLVGIMSSNAETDEEFVKAIGALMKRTIEQQLVHRADLRAKGLL